MSTAASVHDPAHHARVVTAAARFRGYTVGEIPDYQASAFAKCWLDEIEIENHAAK